MASESHSLPHSLQQQLRKLDRKLYKAPGDDNFFTPQNDFFYSKTPYLPLDAKQKEIRLLKVFAPKPYANHIKDHPHWAPIDSVTGELIPVNDNSMPKILSSLQINGLHDLSTPILGCQIIDKVALSKTQAEWMYHAVSYCAGKPTDTTLILVDGLPFNAFANLDHAICKALKYWHSLNPGKELLLWADQICINQRDQAERASQVSLMREVYRRSSLTFICLSTVSTLTCLDWTFYENVGSEVDTFQQVFQKLVNTAITLTHSGGGVTIALSDCINPYKSAHIKSAHIESAQIKSEDSAILTKWLESVKSFTECQWFRRSWVQQEFFVAPRPIFISNNIGVPFNHLFKILEIIRSFSFNELLNLNIPNADTMSQALKDMRQLEDEIYAMTANWEDLVKINIQNHRSHSEDTVRQKLFDIAKAFHHLTNIDIHSKLSANISGSGSAFNFVGGYDILWDHIQARIHHLEEWLRRAAEGEATTTISIRAHRPSFEKYDFSAVSSVMGHKQSMRRTSDLRPLLEISRKLKASDPRDRVYAFLGLAHKEYGTLIPDYSPRKTVVHVLTDAAKAIIEIEKSLGVLEGVYRGRVNLGLYLPTWVPDWTTEDKGCIMAEYIRLHNKTHDLFNTSGSWKAKTSFRLEEDYSPNMELNVQGIHLDYLDEDSGVDTLCSEVHRFLTGKRLNVIVPKSALLDDEVWALFGANKPVLLRPEGDQKYSFLGEVLIFDEAGSFSDIMYGKQPSLEEVDPQAIWLI